VDTKLSYIKEIIKNSSAKILRLGDDIDIYVPKKELYKLLYKLNKENFTIEKNSYNVYSAYKFTDNEIVNLDIICEFRYIGKFFDIYPEIDVDKYILDKEYRKACDLVRYVLLLKKEKKDREKLKQNFNKLEDYFYQFFHEKNVIFKKFPENYTILEKILDEDIFYMFKYLKKYYFLKYLKNKVKLIFNILFKGRCVCFEGPDGSGKSSIINNLKKLDDYRFVYVYMWNKDVFIDDLVKNMPDNILIKILLNFLLFFINWYKYITKIWINKIKGKIVLAERWPTYEYYILYKKDKKILAVLYYLYNYFFPKPDITFILKVDPKIITERKNELEFEEILKLYEIYHTLTESSKNFFVIENNDKISKTLNKILKTINKGMRNGKV